MMSVELEYEEETTEEAANEGGEDENSETQEEVEYQVDEDGEQILDEDGNPIPVEVEGEEEETEKGKTDHKKNAQDRIQQLANALRAEKERNDRLESEFRQSQKKEQEDKPDYYEVDMSQVNDYIQKSSDQIDELKLEGRFLEAKKLELAQAKLIADLDANEIKKQAYIDRKGKATSSATAETERLAKVDQAAIFYRDHMKITPEVWDKMGTWFAGKLKDDALLRKEFQEMVDGQTPTSVVKWAHDYAVKNMGIKEKAAIDAKNTNKQTASGAAPKSSSGKPSVVDLSKALEKAKETGTAEGWVEYQAIKRAASKR